jgi:hypothetical protein
MPRPALLLFGEARLDYLQDLWNFRWSFREMKVWESSYFGTPAERKDALRSTVDSKKNTTNRYSAVDKDMNSISF